MHRAVAARLALVVFLGLGGPAAWAEFTVEDLSTIGPSPVWTGSLPNGRLAGVGTSSGQLIFPGLRTCNDWSDNLEVPVGCAHGDDPPGPCG